MKPRITPTDEVSSKLPFNVLGCLCFYSILLPRRSIPYCNQYNELRWLVSRAATLTHLWFLPFCFGNLYLSLIYWSRYDCFLWRGVYCSPGGCSSSGSPSVTPYILNGIILLHRVSTLWSHFYYSKVYLSNEAFVVCVARVPRFPIRMKNGWKIEFVILRI